MAITEKYKCVQCDFEHIVTKKSEKQAQEALLKAHLEENKAHELLISFAWQDDEE